MESSRWLYQIPFGVMAIFWPVLAFCQTPPDTASKTHLINDVIVTGQYGENSVSQSVYKVRVIDAKRIQLLGANNLKDVLTNELNVRIQNDPALGGSMSIQGISGQNIKIMIDGVPVVGREGGFIDLNQLNLNNIERIELVEGPMSVNFGTDALGGVINLITKKATGTGYRAGVSGYYESIGQYNTSAQFGMAKGKWSTDMQIARNYFDGFSPVDTTREQTWKPRMQYFADLGIKYQLKKGTLRYTISGFTEKVTSRGKPNINPGSVFARDVYFYTNRVSQSLFYDTKLNSHFHLNMVGAVNRYSRVRNTYYKNLVTLQETMVPLGYEQDTNKVIASMSRGTLSHNTPGRKWNYQLGYEANHELFNGGKIEGGQQQMWDVNAFTSMEIKAIPHVLIRPGIRAVYNNKFSAPLIPSLNIKWDVNSFTTVRASYGKGFRAPSLKEQYLDFVDPSHNVQGNPDLKAETQNNYQLSASFEWKKTNKVFRIEPLLFYNHIRNRIDLMMLNASTLEAQYFNISDFRNRGANLTIDYRTPSYSLVGGYAYTGIQTTLPGAPNQQYFFTHEARINANYILTKIALTASVFYKYNGLIRNFVYDTQTGNVVTGFINPFGLLDATLNKTWFNNKITVTAGVKNILNVMNIAASIPSGVHSNGSNTASIAMGRTVFVSLAMQLNWNQTK